MASACQGEWTSTTTDRHTIRRSLVSISILLGLAFVALLVWERFISRTKSRERKE